MKLRDLLKDMEYEKGAVEQYRIMGILSDEIYSRGDIHDDQGKGCIRLIYPMETLIRRYEQIAEAEEKAGAAVPEDSGLYYYSTPVMMAYGETPSVRIGIRRDTEFLDDEIQRFVGDNGRISAQYYFYTYLMNTDMDYFKYMTNVRKLRMLRMAVVILGGFVITVCLVQIVNTLQAGMRMNRRELWLYEVVGMSRSQKLRMQLIEHGLSAVTAYCLGLLMSFLFSYLFVEKLLELGGAGFEYRYPIGIALIMGVVLSLLIVGINVLEMHQHTQDRERAE